jgi:hypothetical protein
MNERTNFEQQMVIEKEMAKFRQGGKKRINTEHRMSNIAPVK